MRKLHKKRIGQYMYRRNRCMLVMHNYYSPVPSAPMSKILHIEVHYL